MSMHEKHEFPLVIKLNDQGQGHIKALFILIYTLFVNPIHAGLIQYVKSWLKTIS